MRVSSLNFCLCGFVHLWFVFLASMAQLMKVTTNAQPQKKKGNNVTDSFVEQKLLSDFIILKRAETIIDNLNSRGILNSSASFCKMRVEYCETVKSTEPIYSCSIRIEGEKVSDATGTSAKEAKDSAAFLALTELQSTNYTILVLGQIDSLSPEIKLDQIQGDLKKMSEAISDGNVGSKLLKKMGWTGGGIGKSEQVAYSRAIAVNS